MKAIFFLISSLIALWLAGCRSAESTADLAPVTGFQPERYLGVWYEIARLPHSFEKGMDRVSAEYTSNPDGSIKVVNRGWRGEKFRSITGRALLSDTPGRGELRVTFFPPFYGDYRIVRLDPDYQWAIVTSSNRDYLWLLARTPEISESLRQELVRAMQSMRFDTARLIWPKPDLQQKLIAE